MKKITSLLLALLMVLSLAVTVSAADSTITYSARNKLEFAPGSGYTDTDLFDDFKGVMPGDTRTETITITNKTTSCDFIKVYLHAVLHHETANPLSPKVEAAGEDVASMSDFLSQLAMTVVNKSNNDAAVFNGKPSALDGLANKVYLGTLRRNEMITLEATLMVPGSLDNAYAYREGEVDWVFTVEEYDDANPDVPKTGDDAQPLRYALLMAVSVTGMFLVLLFIRKKKKEAQ